MAGVSDVASGNRPYFFATCANAAGVPGIAAASAPSSDRRGTGFPAASRYMFARAASGARSRASTIVSKPSVDRCSNQNPPPPRPEPWGSTTASAAATATAASKALPPRARISWPAAVASGCALAMAATPGRGASAGAVGANNKKRRTTPSRFMDTGYRSGGRIAFDDVKRLLAGRSAPCAPG